MKLKLSKFFQILGMCIFSLSQTAQAMPGDMMSQFVDRLKWGHQVISHYDVQLSEVGNCESVSAYCSLGFPYDGDCDGQLSNKKIKSLPLNACSGLIISRKIEALLKKGGYPECSQTQGSLNNVYLLSDCECEQLDEAKSVDTRTQASYASCIHAFPTELRDSILAIEQEVNATK